MTETHAPTFGRHRTTSNLRDADMIAKNEFRDH